MRRPASDEGIEMRTSRVGLDAVGAAIIDGDTDGFIKVVSDATTGALLGAQIAGPQAGDLIYAAAVAIRARMTAEELGAAIAVHPTHAELVYYAGG
jgi:dihydrolipoamide dehydrogenase